MPGIVSQLPPREQRYVADEAQLAGEPFAVDLRPHAADRAVGVDECEPYDAAVHVGAEQRLRLAANGNRAADPLEGPGLGTRPSRHPTHLKISTC